jgi:hypothetical protein
MDIQQPVLRPSIEKSHEPENRLKSKTYWKSFDFTRIRMKTNLKLILISLAVLLASGCRPEATQTVPAIDSDQVATIVAATLNAPKPATETPQAPASATTSVETQVPSPSSSPTTTPSQTVPANETGEVTGRICYRTREVPPMTAFFQETDEKQTSELKIEAGQTSYNIDLAPGEYVAFAWLEDYSLGGLYSEAVPCGMRSDCLDHTAITFEVQAGETLEGIDICDWFAFNVPQPPDRPEDEIRGSISGQINHPDGSPPELHVVAFNLDTSYWYYTLNVAGSTRFTISDLPPGTYHVVAFQRDGRAGGYTDGTHALIPVVVKAGETSSASIADWNLPAASFPPDPTEW